MSKKKVKMGKKLDETQPSQIISEPSQIISEPVNNSTNKCIFVKSNKGKKIELKNLDQINNLIGSGIELDQWIREQITKIKNPIFKNNVVDLEAIPCPQIVSSVRLVKSSKLGRRLTPMVWEYYKNRGNLDVNEIIKQYRRENLIINYSVKQNKNLVKKPNEKIICDDDDVGDDDGNNQGLGLGHDQDQNNKVN